MRRSEAMGVYRGWLAQLPQGWRIELTKGDHVVFIGPGTKVFVPQTPSEYRGMKNARAQLRRASGVKVR